MSTDTIPVCALSNGDISNDLDGPITRFQNGYYGKLIGNHGCRIKSYAIYWIVPLSMTLSDLWPRFQGHDFLKLNIRQEAQLLLTNPTRHLQRSVKITKHSTVPYAMHSFLLVCNSNFAFKTCRFSDIRLEIQVRCHSRSFKVAPFNRVGVVSY